MEQPAAMHYLQAELEHRLESDSTLFEFLRASSLDGVWYWDLEDPEHEWMSPEFWELFGIDPATKQHRVEEWQNLIHPDDRDLALVNLREHLADPDHPYDQVVRYRHADGSTVWVRCRGLAIRNAEGKPIRMLGAHNDITKLKEAEAQLRAANADLDHFTHMAAHDLREPARRQQMMISLIIDRHGHDLPPEVAEELDQIGRQAAQMAAMVNDFRALTGLARGELLRHEVDLADMVRLAGRDLALGESDREWLDVGPLPEISCYPNLVRVLLQNLMTNAHHHGVQPLEVAVTHQRREDARQWFVFSNAWDGDPDAIDNRVFQPFAGRRRPDGLGMGLSICKRVVDRHQGAIVVEPTAERFAVAFTLAPA